MGFDGRDAHLITPQYLTLHFFVVFHFYYCFFKVVKNGDISCDVNSDVDSILCNLLSDN